VSAPTPAAPPGGPPPPPKPELAALRQVRESAQALLRAGKTAETWDFLLAALEAVLVRTQELELLVAKLRRVWRGTRSERLDPAQLQLLLEELAREGGEAAPGDPDAEAQADAALDREIETAEQGQPAGRRRPTRRRKGPGWQTHGVERHTHTVEVPAADRICGQCGRPLKPLGEDVTRRLEYVPGHFVEHEHRLMKYGCGTCKEGVTTAPAPPQVLRRRAAEASLLAHVVVSKFADHTPLHRLSRIDARSGATIPVSTLSDWMAGVGDLADPLVERLAARVLTAFIVGTDATGLTGLDPTHPAHIQRGALWVLVGDRRDVLFRYTPTGEGESGPWKFLAGRRGYVQADAANVFDRLFNGKVASAIELGCWAHGRRRLVALQETDFRVAYPLKLIGRLYRIEHLADVRQLPPDGRAALRQARSTPILETLKHWVVATSATEPPSTDLAQAAAYVLNHWVALTRFVEDGRVSLDNNHVEQQLREIALGRKNYLFAGSHDAARRAAHLYSLRRTCAQYGVPPLPYFTTVLAKLGAGWAADRMEELLPHRWRAEDASPENPRGP
jgi:transposase